MPTRYEKYIADDDGWFSARGAVWATQTFTPAIAHTITSVKLKMYRVGSPDTLTVSIRATSGGEPSGGDLVSGTTNANTLTTDGGGEWREITLGAGFDLNDGVQYAIVIRTLTGDVSNKVEWRVDSLAASYVGGNTLTSANSGGAWTTYSVMDFMFEDWGEPILAAVGGSPLAALIDAGII